ncbi:hypothetical protein DBR40_02895 [Pedobacter sp. KBW01]|uniref:AAA family ATPase n=1 Tax=Pedobacter sp. KBW01 TaxID=2153364 RepID=UPI000F5917B0|nr:AAA family ATPase [Pedobacter sp. KBW01]RQO79326.1 hypothetical protein DBR40_02895 [Pedobacter sp. KBW01]
MMQINFYSLNLNCRKSQETIDLDHQVLFFHGKVSSGKSSIARLINFCLGGSLERTIAIQKELISVSLELGVGKYKVLLERNAASSANVTATCVDDQGKSFAVNVPVNAALAPVYANKVYSLSDLIFYLLDINVLRVPAKKNDQESSSLVRLTLKNFMWYCYLDQSKLDSSFFRLEDGTKTRSSKEILKYVFQYSTQKLIELQEKLQKKKKERFSKQLTAEGLREFLKKFEFSNEDEINLLETKTKNKLEKAKEEKKKVEQGYTSSTHTVDQLRHSIREIIDDLTRLEQGVIDIDKRIEQQESLKSELVASKFKVAKNQTVANVFHGIAFVNCPDCGTNISKRKVQEDSCKLCLSPVGIDKPEASQQSELIQIDLTERIKELESSIDLHKKALNKSKKEFGAKQKIRRELDQKLQHDLKQYESVFLSNVRSLDNTVSTLNERLKSIQRMKVMPREITKLENEAIDIIKEERELKRKINEETANFVRGEQLIEELEKTFLKIMNDVGMPGVSKKDKVSINRSTWEVNILPAGEDYLRWNFYNAGSGGKKTLFNSCFLLAIHIVASKNNLPLPTFIIIDTPMKNIDKEVNSDIFKSFFDLLYKVASTVLDKTQIIIIENNYIPPDKKIKIDFFHRYMESGNEQNPPLIPYYQGP